MLKNIANLTISKEKNNVCLIGRSSAEWRYLGTSQKATATQQCHLVALTETRESNFRLIHSIQTTKITCLIQNVKLRACIKLMKNEMLIYAQCKLISDTQTGLVK